MRKMILMMGDMADWHLEQMDYLKPLKGKTKMAKTDKMPIEEKKVLTPEFRVSFPHVFEKHTGFKGQEPKYSIAMLFDKKTDLKELKRAAYNATVEKWGPKEDWPAGLRTPFRDGDRDPKKAGKAEYKNVIFVSATSKQKPEVVGNLRVDGQFPHIEKDSGDFYAGCYARATLIAFAYDTGANIGVSFSLQNVQKLRDGQNLSGRKTANDEFDDVDDGSNDATNYETEAGGDDAGMGF